ncbi:MAG: Hsp33 family molecular chaperone HslO [Gammaproteobacteria bacterium]|nr:Hsp33 family molecular chaperone HslO [Gammaproteobacteria bacterium]
MNNSDFIQRFLFETLPVRGEYIFLHQSYQTIIAQHEYPPAIKRLLGEALAISGMLSAIIKFEGRLTVQFQGKGPLKLLLAQSDHQFNLRGLAQWSEDLTYEQLMQSLHEGILVVMVDPFKSQNRQQGVVEWRGNSLAESIEHYFRVSEQLPTTIHLAVDDQSAAGFLLQPIPGKRDKIILEEEEIDAYHLKAQNLNLNPTSLLKGDLQTLLPSLFPEDELRIFDKHAVAFKCTCSRERSGEAIYILGRAEAEAELKDKQVITVTCDFCNQEFNFDRHDVEYIFISHEEPPNANLH